MTLDEQTGMPAYIPIAEGEAAGQDGVNALANPYPANTEERVRWHVGGWKGGLRDSLCEGDPGAGRAALGAALVVRAASRAGDAGHHTYPRLARSVSLSSARAWAHGVGG